MAFVRAYVMPIRRKIMPTITRDQVKVPMDVMPEARETYIDN